MRLKTMTLAEVHEFQREAVRIETEITIARSPEDVFDYVTTPALWHTWHPATLGVYDVEPRPLTTGETMREKIAVAWRRSEAVWTVLGCSRPGSWEIGTDTAAALIVAAGDNPDRMHSHAAFASLCGVLSPIRYGRNTTPPAPRVTSTSAGPERVASPAARSSRPLSSCSSSTESFASASNF